MQHPMLTNQEIKILLKDIEADNVERTMSPGKTDKFCEAICAFSNDMPGHAKPALREEQVRLYPSWAIRELLMNAVMHRDYQSNAPIHFYWFSDRIEIQNADGLYGVSTDFPNQNDYRNPKIAEAMKNLGYVNRFGRGIARTQALLQKNGNPPAEFDFSHPTFFLATIPEAES